MQKIQEEKVYKDYHASFISHWDEGLMKQLGEKQKNADNTLVESLAESGWSFRLKSAETLKVLASAAQTSKSWHL